MSYAQTKFIWDDQSDIDSIASPAEDTVDRPVFMTGFSSDKGPEEYQQLMGDKFFKLYGTKPSFYKHGQTLIQAAKVINAGGRLFCKRIVAEDATLANIGVVAKVAKEVVQKADENGNPVYTDGNNETTDPVGNQPVMVQKCKITYELKTVNIAGNSLPSMAAAFLADNAHQNTIGEDDHYPLFLIADNGRGVSNKKFRIYADTSASRPVDYVKYILKVIENGTELESMTFTINPDIIEKDSNIALQNVISSKSNQIRCRMFEDEITAFMENVAYISGVDTSEFEYSDVLFGCDLYGQSYGEIIIDSTVQLDSITGISLVGGSNGLFGDRPIVADTYASELVKVFNGTAGDEIYDLDNSRIDVVFDANYPAIVKREIENLTTFREDMFYFRDMGTGLTSIEEIKLANAENLRNRFCATYHNSWDVKDPYTKKQITITIMYTMCTNFVKHFLNGRARPFCGQLYEVTFPEVISGTVNFVPKNTPKVDQKQYFDDNRINYATYYSDLLTLESEYTSQERLTQLSWLHNVLMTQELIKEIRVKCPKIRYNFITGDDLTKYKDDVQAILDRYTTKFNTIELVYTRDSAYEANKIFYAVIKVTYKDFVQTEIFKISAMRAS
jgi:hypothetical protein